MKINFSNRLEKNKLLHCLYDFEFLVQDHVNFYQTFVQNYLSLFLQLDPLLSTWRSFVYVKRKNIIHQPFISLSFSFSVFQ